MAQYNKKLENAVFLQIRLDKETKEQFQSICKDRAINQSELLRQWIEKSIQKHEQA